MGVISKFLKDILTEDDANSIFCPVRVIGASGFLVLVGNATYLAIAHASFDAVSFGTGVASIAAATGAGAGLKARLGG